MSHHSVRTVIHGRKRQKTVKTVRVGLAPNVIPPVLPCINQHALPTTSQGPSYLPHIPSSDGLFEPSSDAAPSDGFELPPNLSGQDGDMEDIVYEHHIGARNEPTAKTKRSNALEEWLPLRDKYLATMSESEGLPQHTPKCSQCPQPDGLPVPLPSPELHRCIDCFQLSPLCSTCMVNRHSDSPLHRMETWNGTFWRKNMLCRLGLSIPLGHHGTRCDAPINAGDYIIVHTNGFHRVHLLFCGCREGIGNRRLRTQFLRNRLFPSTTQTPRTAFTFELLDLLVHLSTRSKVSVATFYSAMREITDSMEVDNWPKRYDELSHAVRWYRHLLLLKRAGIAFKAEGTANVKPGELALSCPACPHPGRNTSVEPSKEVRLAKRHLYTTFLASDANFRLKQKERGFNRDQYLGPGWSYFVDPILFKTQLDRVEKNPPRTKNMCESTHDAIERANTRAREGYAVTGVAGVVCARHGVILPGMTDLQVGERQVNMDMANLTAYQHVDTEEVDESYDVACEYLIHLAERAAEFPEHMRLAYSDKDIRWGIPKFHCPVHGEFCRSNYTMNHRTGYARTDGEGIERNWSDMNGFSTQSKEMGPGARHDFLDYQMTSLSFRKIVGLGSQMLAKLTKAVKAVRKLTVPYEEIRAAIPKERLQEWQTVVDEWQLDHKIKPNPYEDEWEAKGGTLSELKKDLALQEVAELQAGRELGHSVTLGDFVLQGVELEDSQESLLHNLKSNPKPSATEAATQEKKRTNIYRRFLQWTAAQSAYYMPPSIQARLEAASEPVSSPRDAMPSTVTSNDRAEDDDFGSDDEWENNDEGESDHETDGADSSGNRPSPGSAVGAETYKLYLPSGLDAHRRFLCNPSLIRLEIQVRLATLQSLLNKLRRLLRVRARVLQQKKAHVVGQRGGTRAYKILHQYKQKINFIADRYRSVRDQLLKLNDTTSLEILATLKQENWQNSAESDLDEESDVEKQNTRKRKKKQNENQQKRAQALGEGSKEVSWIWRVAYDPDNDDSAGFDTAAFVVWAKAQSRLFRWQEELELVQEEMRRILWDLEKTALAWDHRAAASLDHHLDQAVKLGLRAYAIKNAYMWRRLWVEFSGLWRMPLEKMGEQLDWPTHSLGEISYLSGFKAKKLRITDIFKTM